MVGALNALPAYLAVPAVALMLTAMFISDERRLARAVKMYSLQSALLATVFALMALHGDIYLLAWAASAIVTKTVLVPLILLRLVKRTEGYEAKPLLGSTATWLASGVGAAAGIALGLSSLGGVQGLLLGVSVALFLIGLVQMTVRRSLVKQLLGFCHFENGSHLTLAVMAPGLPETVEIGIATDAVLLILVGSFVAYIIWCSYRTLDYTRLRMVREEG